VKLRASIVVPVKNEAVNIKVFLNGLDEFIPALTEVLVVADDFQDESIKEIMTMKPLNFMLRPLVSNYGSGPANAIRFGIDNSRSDIAVVVMADGSDDPRNIEELIRLIERGCSVAAASRYMPGGQQIGGPPVKRLLSRLACFSLRVFGRIPIHDSTNSFKGYDINFIREVGLQSSQGFEIGLEIVAKAHRCKKLMAEIPTIWIDRQFGESKFKLLSWLPHYIKWFVYAFTGRLVV
jgi:dolichol-phosphate mannosyltransferase